MPKPRDALGASKNVAEAPAFFFHLPEAGESSNTYSVDAAIAVAFNKAFSFYPTLLGDVSDLTSFDFRVAAQLCDKGRRLRLLVVQTGNLEKRSNGMLLAHLHTNNHGTDRLKMC